MSRNPQTQPVPLTCVSLCAVGARGRRSRRKQWLSSLRGSCLSEAGLLPRDFGFIWGMMLLHLPSAANSARERLHAPGADPGPQQERYIKALAEENRNVVDGPYAGS